MGGVQAVRAHVEGKTIGKAIDMANLDPTSDSFVQDLVRVVSDVAAMDVREQLERSSEVLGREINRLRIEMADPDREIRRYLEMGR